MIFHNIIYRGEYMRSIEEIRKTPRLMIEAEAEEATGIGGRYLDLTTGKYLNFIFSNQLGWEHLSVSMPSRTPSWDQMCMMKDIFWSKDEACVEYHPREEDYVNNHNHCLHIWRPTDETLPIPPSILVGFRNEAEKQAFLKAAELNGVSVNKWDYNKRDRS